MQTNVISTIPRLVSKDAWFVMGYERVSAQFFKHCVAENKRSRVKQQNIIRNDNLYKTDG